MFTQAALLCPRRMRLWQRSRKGSRTNDAKSEPKEKINWAIAVAPRLPRRSYPASFPSRIRYPRGMKSKDPAAQ